MICFNPTFMLVSPETVKQDIDLLNSEQLQQVADFIAFLKFRNKCRRIVWDRDRLASLANEFADEDLALAEAGMSDYAAILD
jgi:hypothetical protein